jgi:hypothetical protein
MSKYLLLAMFKSKFVNPTAKINLDELAENVAEVGFSCSY